MFVKPKAGLRVRDPVKKDVLPEEGREVADSPYWQRRLLDKDVTIESAPAAKSAPALGKTDPAGGEA